MCILMTGVVIGNCVYLMTGVVTGMLCICSVCLPWFPVSCQQRCTHDLCFGKQTQTETSHSQPAIDPLKICLHIFFIVSPPPPQYSVVFKKTISFKLSYCFDLKAWSMPCLAKKKVFHILLVKCVQSVKMCSVCYLNGIVELFMWMTFGEVCPVHEEHY